MLDALIAAISPRWAVQRAHHRRILAAYEAAKPDRYRKGRREPSSGSAAVTRAGTSIREQARHLEQNLDLARGILRVLINSTIGPHGIGVEPQPLRADGTVHEEFARQILAAWDRWGEVCDVTGEFSWPEAQRMLARTAYRDGDAFARFVSTGTRHATRIPLSLELMEPDFFPIGHDGQYDGRSVRDAIELNAWGKPLAYWAYRDHPGHADSSRIPWADLKRIPADEILHLAMRDRLHQRRGMSLFAAILARLDHLADYETSETIAAKVAASFGAAIVKGSPDSYPIDISDDDEPRDMRFRPGMIMDQLEPGERIEMVGSNGRPNSDMNKFRNNLIKAATSGVGANSAGVTREYDGSYSARRQELVDSMVDSEVMSQQFAAKIVRPVFRRVIDSAIGVGELVIPSGVVNATNATYTVPRTPWVDPASDAKAWATLIESGLASSVEAIRQRGRSPADVLAEEQQWMLRRRELGLADPPKSEPDMNDDEDQDAERDAA
ncbi:MAG: phage portal protein [Gammaproteobacteria bacterium]|nr:phage portal protein [Gammaproteobacteria bacterium]